jgi:3-oxoadipate enol-lactonase
MWNEMIVHLSDKYRVITIDARAHGKSEVPSSEFTIKDLAIDHIKVMDELSIEKAHMVGISMGGMVALNSVLLAPERVESLVLMDTEGGKPPWKNWFERWLLARTVQKTGLLWFSVGTMINRMFGSTFRKEKPLLIEEWKKVLSNLSPESITLAIDAINNRPPLISRLGEVNTRTLLIYGDEDFYTPIKSGRLIESGIRGSKMVTLQNAGHLTVVEKPEEVAAIVDKFCSNQKAYD